MKKLELYKRVLTALCQWLVGLVFAFSGIVKCIDPVGAQIKLTEYLLYFGMDWLADWTWIIAWVQALVEFSFGLCVCFGRYRRSVLPLTMLFMCFMTPLTLWLALTDPIEDCGCFGDAIILTNWQTFTKNVVLLAASIWLMFNRRHMLNVLSANFFVLYYYGLLMGCVLLLACGTFRLPFIDFRPYRPGVDLRAATQGGVGKKVSEYVCVYEKEGERREFSLDDLPDEAEGWVFVDAYEVTPVGGSDVQEHDDLPFFALKTDGTDFTSELLADTGYTFLLLSPALSEASEHDLDRIENIYEYARQEGYAFYGLTLADTTQLLHWVYRTGAEYEMLFSDQTVIQTMIRCNPGLMLLHDGIILWKTHLAELDMMTLLSVRLSEQSYGQMQSINQKKRVFWIILWLIVPLCLYLPLQIVKHRFNKKDKKMRKKIVAGNWKMNTTLQEGVALAEGLKEALAGKKVNCDVVVCTPFISVASVVKAVEGSVIGVGAEDCSAHDKGAYTGEVAANMVASTGAKYVILGHSERRQYHGENNEILVAKLQQALANGLTPIFCVGEVKEERENGTFKAVIEGQMEAMYTLSAEDFAKCVVAYEPVWAIGTGLTATSEQAQEVHAFIRASIAKKYNAEVADNTSILYGGSCKGSNAPELFAQPDIDGGLIGGAALKVDTFMPIIEAWK